MTTGPLAPLVLTGVTGFIGRRLLRVLVAESAHAVTPRSVTVIIRHPSSLQGIETLPAGWRVVPWDLASGDELPAGVIGAGSVVMHLAAATGRSAAAAMAAANVGGTTRLVRAAATAKAGHFLFVSSIAAGFATRRWYPYAASKRAAEAVVLGGGLPATIVRPTMVFGPGSPVQEGLERLATGGAPIVPGSGTVRIQPVHVDDVATLLLALADERPEGNRVLEVGGGEQLSMRDLLARIRIMRGLPPRDPMSVRLGLPRLGLAMAEQVPGLRLPVTAGQLSSFLNDSIAQPSAIIQRLLPAPQGIGQMLEPLPTLRGAGLGEAGQEFAVFARYLGTPIPGAQATAAYVRGEPAAAAIPGDALDGVLLRLARRSGFWCGVADGYARLARPHGGLRRRLVLTLAVLESTPGVHAAYDTALSSSALSAWMSIGAQGVRWILRTFLAVLLLAPQHLTVRLRSREVGHG